MIELAKTSARIIIKHSSRSVIITASSTCGLPSVAAGVVGWFFGFLLGGLVGSRTAQLAVAVVVSRVCCMCVYFYVCVCS